MVLSVSESPQCVDSDGVPVMDILGETEKAETERTHIATLARERRERIEQALAGTVLMAMDILCEAGHATASSEAVAHLAGRLIQVAWRNASAQSRSDLMELLALRKKG